MENFDGMGSQLSLLPASDEAMYICCIPLSETHVVYIRSELELSQRLLD